MTLSKIRQVEKKNFEKLWANSKNGLAIKIIYIREVWQGEREEISLRDISSLICGLNLSASRPVNPLARAEKKKEGIQQKQSKSGKA